MIVVAALAGACGRVGFDAGDAVDAAIDAAPCIPPAGDNDDDGDGVTDTCDTCPHIPGPQSDGDGDRVGDICDPRTTPTETLAKFEPFLAPLPWSTGGVPFTVAPSALVSTTVGNSAWVGYSDDPTNTEAVMRGRLDAVGTGAKQLSIQFALELGDGAEYCEVYSDPVTSFKITRGIPPDTFVTLAGMTIPPLATGPFTMRYGHGPDGFHCSLAIGGTTYEISSPETFATPRDFIVLQFIDLDVTLESFAQVDTTL